MNNVLKILNALTPYLNAGVGIFGVVQSVFGQIYQAHAEGRDLTDAEIAQIQQGIANADQQWQQALAALRAAAAPPPDPPPDPGEGAPA